MKTFVRDSLGAISQMDMLIGDGYYQVTITVYVLLRQRLVAHSNFPGSESLTLSIYCVACTCGTFLMSLVVAGVRSFNP